MFKAGSPESVPAENHARGERAINVDVCVCEGVWFDEKGVSSNVVRGEAKECLSGVS